MQTEIPWEVRHRICRLEAKIARLRSWIYYMAMLMGLLAVLALAACAADYYL